MIVHSRDICWQTLAEHTNQHTMNPPPPFWILKADHLLIFRQFVWEFKKNSTQDIPNIPSQRSIDHPVTTAMRLSKQCFMGKLLEMQQELGKFRGTIDNEGSECLPSCWVTQGSFNDWSPVQVEHRSQLKVLQLGGSVWHNVWWWWRSQLSNTHTHTHRAGSLH